MLQRAARRISSRVHLSLAAAGIVFGVLGAGLQGAAAQCPVGSIQCNQTRFESADASLTSTCFGVTASYDVVNGRLAATAGPGSFAIVRFVDQFELAGIAAPTPVPLQIHLSLTGFLAAADVHYGALVFLGFGFTQGDVQGSLRQAFDSHFSAFEIDHVLTLDATIVPGEPFEVACNVQLNGIDRGGRIEGLLTFDGLPPGTRVQSCKGFEQAAVAVVRTTWGTIKALF